MNSDEPDKRKDMQLIDAMADLFAERVAEKLAPLLNGRPNETNESQPAGDFEKRSELGVLTRTELAELLKTSESTVERLTMRGMIRMLPGFERPPRYAVKEVKRFLATFS